MKIHTTLFLIAAAATPAFAAGIVFEASGSTAADITGAVNSFRSALGPLNLNTPVNNASGRREINWDAVPDARSSPNAFPGDFFNGNVSPRARGVEFTTPGTGFEVSGKDGVAPVRFDNLNALYSGLFDAFSPERLFTPIGGVETTVSFFSPADQVTKSFTAGFGVVFTDVDLALTTALEFFDTTGMSLGKYFAPAANGDKTFSFVGVYFNGGEKVGSVKITGGNLALGGLEGIGQDLVAMDDFIYGEQGVSGVPEPSTYLMMMTGLALPFFGRLKKRMRL